MAERYEITASGTDSPLVRAAFAEFEVSSVEPGQVRMVGTLPDQAALHGALHRLQDLGLGIIDVHLSQTN